MMNIETVKGFRDVLPPDSLKRNKIKQIIEKNFMLYGFIPIETPTIEYEDIARGNNENDSAVSERFKFNGIKLVVLTLIKARSNNSFFLTTIPFNVFSSLKITSTVSLVPVTCRFVTI